MLCNSMFMRVPLLVLFVLVFALAPAQGQNSTAEAPKEAQEEAPSAEALIIRAQRPSYPSACPVSGEELGPESEVEEFVHEGRLVRTCCSKCKKKFLRNPQRYLADLDEMIVQDQLASYALSTCPVTGNDLAEAEGQHDYVHGTRLVRLCSEGCVEGFHEDVATAMKKVDAALIDAQRADYPLKTCPVMTEMNFDTMGEPYDLLYGTRLVRLCCQACEKEFQAHPEKYMAVLDQLQ